MRSSLQARTNEHRHPSARPRYPRSQPIIYFSKNEFKESIVLKFTHIFTKIPRGPSQQSNQKAIVARCGSHLRTHTLRRKPRLSTQNFTRSGGDPEHTCSRAHHRAAVGPHTVCEKCPLSNIQVLTSSQGASLSAPEGSHESVIVSIDTFELV
jgi:hypothetical protein